MDGGLEEVRQLFKHGLILRPVLHGLVELARAVLRLLDCLVDIRREVGGGDVGDARAARHDKGHRKAERAEPDRQALQKALPCGGVGGPRQTGQGDEDGKRRLDSIPDQDLLQKQDHEDGHKIEVHVRQAVRQGGREVVRQRGDR